MPDSAQALGQLLLESLKPLLRAAAAEGARLALAERAADAEASVPASAEMAPGALLTSSDVMGLLGLSRTALWKLRSDGRLTALHINRRPRFRRADVEALINPSPKP